MIIDTRCSTRETRETALLHVACGNPARRRYCMGAKFSCISSSHAYSYIQQSGRNLQTMNAKNTKKITAAILVTVTSAVLGADFHTHGQTHR